LGKLRNTLNQLRHILNLDLTDPRSWQPSAWMFYPQSDGTSVNEYTALNLSAVFNATRIYSETISSLPLNLIQKNDGRTRIMRELPAHQLLHTAANEYMTAMTFREVLMAHVLLWGNGYAEKVYNGYGQLAELWPITPNRVKIDMKDGELIYEIQLTGAANVILTRANCLHVAGLGFDGFRGYSVVALAARSLGLTSSLETFGSNYFEKGTHPGMIVSHQGKLSDQGSKNLRESLQATYGGLGKSHRLMLLEEGMQAAKVSVAPEESQFLQSRQFQITEVARWFNLPPHKIKDLTKSSFSNIESEQISFVTESILPWVVRLEQNFNMQLLTPQERKKYYYKHSVEGLLRGDSAARGEFYNKLWNMGAISINEIRELEDFDPIENGDEHFIPLNMAPLSKLNQQPEPEPQEADNEPEPVQEPDPQPPAVQDTSEK
jgi:HK97 family phage portal protein